MTTQWISVNGQLGYPVPGNVDSSPLVPIGTVASFRDVGTTQLGVGEFIYLKGVASTVLGSVVSYQSSDGTAAAGTTALWAGTANTPVSLAFASAAIGASSYGWYQIGGSAVAAISGTIAAGNSLYWQAAGVLSATAVDGKNVENLQASSADGVPDTGQAIVTIDRPLAQGHDDTVTSVELAALTVDTLPAGVAGQLAYVSDGDAALAWGDTVVNSGAGATPYLVWFNGTAWTVAGK